jgi:hypothetical protein
LIASVVLHGADVATCGDIIVLSSANPTTINQMIVVKEIDRGERQRKDLTAFQAAIGADGTA